MLTGPLARMSAARACRAPGLRSSTSPSSISAPRAANTASTETPETLGEISKRCGTRPFATGGKSGLESPSKVIR
jgi:hypothetical protein